MNLEFRVTKKFVNELLVVSLTVTKHYRTNPKKKGKNFRYVFRIIDIDTGMYVGFGYSGRREKIGERWLYLLSGCGTMSLQSG